MASRTITVRAVGRLDGGDVTVDQFRNFGESVFTWLRHQKGAGEVELDEIDSAVRTFSIHQVHASMSRRVQKWVTDEARRHYIVVSLDVQQQ
jgi:hypothetical protein